MSEQMELLRALIQQITIQDISTVPIDEQHLAVELIESLQDLLMKQSFSSNFY